VAEEQEDYAKALDYYQQACALHDPQRRPDEYAVLQDRMGDLSLLQGDLERANEHLEVARQLDPENLNMLMVLARTQEARGAQDAATATYDQLRRLLTAQKRPWDATTTRRLAWVYYKQGDFDQALAYCARVTAPPGDTDTVRAQVIAAAILYLQEDQRSAQTRIERLQAGRLFTGKLRWEARHDIQVVRERCQLNVDLEPFLAMLE
jgi:tetratricopeptide (TPR) repeat protein